MKPTLLYVYSLIVTFSRQGGRDLGEKRSRVITYRHSRMDLRRQVAQDQRTDLFSEHKRLAGLLLRRSDLQIVADLHRVIGRFGQFLQAQFGDRFEPLAQASPFFEVVSSGNGLPTIGQQRFEGLSRRLLTVETGGIVRTFAGEYSMCRCQVATGFAQPAAG